MILYFARRLGFGLVLTLLVTFITFFLLSFSFDSVARSIAGVSATDDVVAGVKDRLGMSQPVIVQYGDFLAGIFRGDLGSSFFTGEPVLQGVLARLSVTMSVIVVALTITLILSVTLGVLAATRGGAVDKVAQGLSLFGFVFPGLLLAIGLVAVFAVTLRLVPATGFTPIGTDAGMWLKSIILPVIVLAVAGVANLSSQVRGAMIDESRKDYVRTLRTRGIPTRSIVLKHALRNAAGPALTVLSLEFIAMFGSALIIEKVFALPGFGSYAFNASLRGDVPVIMAITLFSTLLVIVVNLVADVANGWLNPKARLF